MSCDDDSDMPHDRTSSGGPSTEEAPSLSTSMLWDNIHNNNNNFSTTKTVTTDFSTTTTTTTSNNTTTTTVIMATGTRGGVSGWVAGIHHLMVAVDITPKTSDRFPPGFLTVGGAFRKKKLNTVFKSFFKIFSSIYFTILFFIKVISIYSYFK